MKDGAVIDVLIPTYERPAALALTLTSLAFKARMPARIIVADQSQRPVSEHDEVQAVAALLRQRGCEVAMLRNLPRRGLAHQRQFLLDASSSERAMFLDDDVIVEPWLVSCSRTSS